MQSYREVLLLPDPLFVVRFMRKDPFYIKKLARCTKRSEMKKLIAKARKELSNVIMITESDETNLRRYD